jgi:Holliday junction resolvasome RuvABC endonuclease subunit
MLRVLALDLSLTATGWAMGSHMAFTSAVLASAKLRGMIRLNWIRGWLREVMEHDDIDLVVLEGYSFGSKGRAVINLGELGGVIRLELFGRRMPVAEVPPASLKKYATGRGNAPKEEVLAAAIRRLDFSGHDHNEADAKWLLTMALDHYGQLPESPVPKAHRDALAKVAWPTIERRAAA